MISIITSLYKSEKYLQSYLKKVEVFEQVLSSQKINFEFIVITNDISKEERHTLLPFRNKPWMRIIEVPRESLYATWNRGVREAAGEHVGFWNVDDGRTTDPILPAIKALSGKTDLVYFPFIYKRYLSIYGIKLLVKNKIINPPHFEKERFKSEMHAGPFFIFKKSFFKKVGPFDESFKIAGDFEWLSRASQLTDFEKIPIVGGVFTNDGTSLTGRSDILQQEENMRIIKSDILSRTIPFPFLDTIYDYEDLSGNIRLYHFLKAARCINFLKKNAATDKIFLDAGAGKGQYCLVAAKIYKTIYCYEYDESELTHARNRLCASNIVFVKVDLTSIPLEDESVDTAVCSEVLEHIPDNTAAIKELYRVLKKDGTLLISMPNRFSLFYQKVWHLNQKKWYPVPTSPLSDPYFEARRHLEYPFWKIEALAKSAGFYITKRQGANIIPLPDMVRKKLMYKYPLLFKAYLSTEQYLSSLLPFFSSFYFLTLRK